MNAIPNTSSELASAVRRCDLIVNCTSVGMRHTATEGNSPLPPELIPPAAVVFDIVYNPLETRLLAEARGRGARTVHGLAMLVYQGAASFELWTGLPAPVDVMMAAAAKAMGLEVGSFGSS